MTRGLVIGKFYPPHRGHKFLIDTALSQVDELDVLVCTRPEQTIPGELRRQWLEEIHPKARVRAINDPGKDDDSQFWADYTVRILGQPPDVVFTSEDYGDDYARFLHSRHVCVDRKRCSVPISGSEVRLDPIKNWDYLEPCVRAYFAIRISVIGAESTGTTTLARDLAQHYGTVWVPEYGREYCERLQSTGVDLWTYKWRSEEFTEIARHQQDLEDDLARKANRVLICDTDVLATSIWHERYVGTQSPAVKMIADRNLHDFYLLTDCDIPFVQDGLRDGESLRQWMTQRFEEELSTRRLPWLKLSGSRDDRLREAVDQINAVCN